MHWSKLEGTRIWTPRRSGNVQACLVCCSGFLPTCFSYREPDREHQLVLYGLRQESSKIWRNDSKSIVSLLSMSCFYHLSFQITITGGGVLAISWVTVGRRMLSTQKPPKPHIARLRCFAILSCPRPSQCCSTLDFTELAHSGYI